MENSINFADILLGYKFLQDSAPASVNEFIKQNQHWSTKAFLRGDCKILYRWSAYGQSFLPYWAAPLKYLKYYSHRCKEHHTSQLCLLIYKTTVMKQAIIIISNGFYIDLLIICANLHFASFRTNDSGQIGLKTHLFPLPLPF